MHALSKKKYKKATLYPEHFIWVTKVFLGEIQLHSIIGTIPDSQWCLGENFHLVYRKT